MKTNSLPEFIQNALEINIIGPCCIDNTTLNLDLPTLLIDGGINHQLELEKQFSIGDGDSSNNSLDILLPVEKNLSDLSYAIHLLNLLPRRLYVYGMIGKRKDHEIINIGELYRFSKKSHSYIKFDKNFIIIPKGEHTIKILGEFTIMTLEESLLTIQGQARYTLDKSTELLPFSSLGLSNIGHGEVIIKANSPLIIYTEGQSLALP